MDRFELKKNIGTLDYYSFDKLYDELVFYNDQIEVIASDAFYRQGDKIEIYYYGSLKEYLAIQGKNNIPRNSTVHLFFDGEEKETTIIKIGKDVTHLDEHSFRCCRNIISIDFENEHTSIGEYAFISCENLTHINLPKVIEELPEGLFCGCSSLEHIAIPETVRFIRLWAFEECESLESVVIPEDLVELEGAFTNCISLREIDLKSNISTIRKETFKGCINLKKVIIRSNIKIIEDGAFLDSWDHKSLDELMIYYYGSLLDWLYLEGKDNLVRLGGVYLYLDGEKETTVINYDYPIKMPPYAFCNCINLKCITIDENVTEIGEKAFIECINLMVLVLPSTIEHFGDDIFDSCYSLNLFFLGNEEEMKRYISQHECFIDTQFNIYYYKEEKPKENGFYWHYNNNKIEIY